MPVTRLSLDGYGARRAGSFAGKESSAHGPHNPGRITRLSLDGYGAKRAGSFAGKETTGGGAHPVGRITRLSLDGYGVKRTGVFGGKEASGGVTPTPPVIVVPSGVKKGGGKRRIVRRADFSSQENYEAALRAALQERDFAFAPEQPKPQKQERKPETVVPVESDEELVSLFVRVIENDTAIPISASSFAALQRPMSEQELLELFITIIENE